MFCAFGLKKNELHQTLPPPPHANRPDEQKRGPKYAIEDSLNKTPSVLGSALMFM